MTKSMKKVCTMILSLLMTVPVVACGGGGGGGNTSKPDNSTGNSASDSTSSGGEIEQKYDPEERPLVFATETLDGNFNPFFSTSMTDSTIVSQTQIGMMSSDKNGNPVCGDDLPTVALDHTVTMFDGNGYATTNGAAADYTEYEFLIKNGIKFSDGQELTIKDVLFNLYVYLDPVYTGSATIYSTDIKGLKSYRTQEPTADEGDGDDSALTQTFKAYAQTRFDNMIAYLDPANDYVAPTGSALAQIEADIATMKRLFLEEATSDWNSYESASLENYQKEYTFTENWQPYYMAMGIVYIEVDSQGKPRKTEDGKYITNLDTSDHLAQEIEVAVNDEAKIAEYMSKNNCDEEKAKEYILKDTVINVVYKSYTESNAGLANIYYYGFNSAYKAIESFTMDEKTKYFNDLKDKGELPVKNISGIRAYKTSTFDGETYADEHYVLKVTINGVDPKAIYNFSFAVAPMHYYASGTEALAKAQAATVPATLDDVAWETYGDFGVEYGDSGFFGSEVLQRDSVSGMPVGAGVYKATNDKGSDSVDRKGFYNNGIVYFKRNEHFQTVGSGLHNANIKYMRYVTVRTDNIMNNLETKEIDVGTPNATPSNVTAISGLSHLGYKQYRTNGYGYVGINPKYVPDIEVRRAIMKAMNTAYIMSYYGSGLAQIINRPMSLESWAYPKNADGTLVGEYESVIYYGRMENGAIIGGGEDAIIELVESAGWTLGSDGKYYKGGKKLKLTFTIAGESTDHPAYNMFQDAADLLNDLGFEIDVINSVTALQDLATGSLAVWAAAWSSTIDPDLYQVYHKDSTATSVNNWGYSHMFNDANNTAQTWVGFDGNGKGKGQFDYERETITLLSGIIEKARKTIDQNARIDYYAQALDLIMDLAVEFPTYQRNDLIVYNKNVVNAATLNLDPSAYEGVFDRLWEVNYN